MTMLGKISERFNKLCLEGASVELNLLLWPLLVV